MITIWSDDYLVVVAYVINVGWIPLHAWSRMQTF
jgi:hypothetical protein